MSRLRVLTVDDEAHVHAGLDSLIDWHELGYEHIGAAANGVEGLARTRDLRPDVVITDIRMPGLDGLALIREIRKLPEYRPAVIVLSGYDDFEYARGALRYGVRDYLLKPVDEDELAGRLTSIRRSLRKRTAPHTEIPENRIDRLAAMSNMARRVVLAPVTDELAAAARSMFADVSEQFCYVLLIPASAKGMEPTPGPALSVESIRVALESTLVARLSAVPFYDEYPDCVGLLVQVRSGGRPPGRRSSVVRGGPSEGDLPVRALHRALQERLSRGLFLVAGPVVDSMESARASRECVVRAITARHRVAGSGYFSARAANAPGDVDGAAEAQAGMDLTVAVSTADDVLDSIESENRKEATDAVQKAFARFGAEGVSSDVLRDWIFRVVSECERLISDLEAVVPSEVSRVRALAKHVEVADLALLERCTLDSVSAAVERISEKRRFARHGVILLVKRRIDRGYAADLSLASFAADYEMNAVYLGQLFSRVVGVGFKEYLRERRVRAACRLLRSTDLRVSEVAASVGYRDVDHFHEQFRRITGTTPAAYRDTHR